MRLTDEQIDLIANDGFRNAAGGIYATSVHGFARAIIAGAGPADSDYKRMFEDAVRSLAAIDASLGIDPDEAGGAAPILEAIAQLKDRGALAAPVIANTAKPIYMIRFNDEPYVWEQVSNKELWDITEPGDKCVLQAFAAPAIAAAPEKSKTVKQCEHCNCNYPLHDLDCPVAVAIMRSKSDNSQAVALTKDDFLEIIRDCGPFATEDTLAERLLELFGSLSPIYEGKLSNGKWVVATLTEYLNLPKYLRRVRFDNSQAVALSVFAQEAVRMLEGYAESYESMSRMNGGNNTVHCSSVAFDIRNNMAGWIKKHAALSAPANKEPE